jgi:hypothetical protein
MSARIVVGCTTTDAGADAAAKMLHELPVSMVVVPRTRDHHSKNGAR